MKRVRSEQGQQPVALSCKTHPDTSYRAASPRYLLGLTPHTTIIRRRDRPKTKGDKHSLDDKTSKPRQYVPKRELPPAALSLTPGKLSDLLVRFANEEREIDRLVAIGRSLNATEDEKSTARQYATYLEARAMLEELRPRFTLYDPAAPEKPSSGFMVRFATDAESQVIRDGYSAGPHEWVDLSGADLPTLESGRPLHSFILKEMDEPVGALLTAEDEMRYQKEHERGRRQTRTRMNGIYERLANGTQSFQDEKDLLLHMRAAVYSTMLESLDRDDREHAAVNAYIQVIGKISSGEYEHRKKFDSYCMSLADSRGSDIRKGNKSREFLEELLGEPDESEDDGSRFQPATDWSLEEQAIKDEPLVPSESLGVSFKVLKPKFRSYAKDLSLGLKGEEPEGAHGVDERKLRRRKADLREMVLNGVLGTEAACKARRLMKLKEERRERRLKLAREKLLLSLPEEALEVVGA